MSTSATGAEQDPPTSAPAPAAARRRWPRILAVVGLVLLGLVAAVVAVWILRFPEADQAALQAVLDDPDVVVTTTDDVVTIGPADGDSTATLVFYPGAAVPPTAYLANWAPVVERTGMTVRIPSVPLRLAVLDIDAAAAVRAAAGPEVADDTTWWVGGHSLGGAMAASFLADQPAGDWEGVVFWASYPSGDALADRADLSVVSVSGTRDGLSTVDDVEASRADLPPDSDFVVLEGVSHAQFGAYGAQSGDLEPTVDDEQARRLIATATVEGVDAE